LEVNFFVSDLDFFDEAARLDYQSLAGKPLNFILEDSDLIQISTPHG
jgi:hypothetical protein